MFFIIVVCFKCWSILQDVTKYLFSCNCCVTFGSVVFELFNVARNSLVLGNVGEKIPMFCNDAFESHVE